MNEEEEIITTDSEIEEILHNHFGTVFTSQNLNNVPEFSMSYRKNIEAPMTYFKINEQIILKLIIKVSRVR